jgi:hypothetical protein
MATYIQGLTQYLPQIQPFQRDFNFYANVMQKKQTEYDSGHEQMNKLYGSVFYSDVSRGDMKERKDEILKAIDFNLKKVSALDVSLKQNQRQAQQVFRPFYEDKELMKDIVYTKTYQQEMQRGLSAKECVGKDCPETYWDGGIRLLEHQMNQFKNASLKEAMQMRNPSYTPYFNIMKEGAKLVKENGFEIVTQGPQGGYIVKEKNGPQAIMSFNDFLFQQFSNDPRAVDFYNAKAQLSFYDNPEETINQYELHRIRQRAKDENDYKELLAEHKKEKEFNKSKNIVSAAKDQTGKQLANKTLERKVFQDYANDLGELFNTSPDRSVYDQIVREEETLDNTYQSLNNLEDNFRGISYIDRETGERVPEHIITSVVANGMLVNETLGVAQSIAMNTYQQTVTGADPYAMADYRHQLAKQLIDYRNEQSLIYGTGSSQSAGKAPGVKLTDAEKKAIDKRIESEYPGLNKEGLDVLKQKAYLDEGLVKFQEIIEALDTNKISPKQLENLKTIAANTVAKNAQIEAVLNNIVATTTDKDFKVQEVDPNKGNTSSFALAIQKYSEGLYEYSNLKSNYDNQHVYNVSKVQEALNESGKLKANIGKNVQNQILNLISNPGNLNEKQKNAVELVLNKVLPSEVLNNPSEIPARLASLQDKDLNKLYSFFLKANDNIDKLRDEAATGFNILQQGIKSVTGFKDAVALGQQASTFRDAVLTDLSEIEQKPQVQTQVWKDLGLPEENLRNLILTSQRDIALKRRLADYNKANKEALNLAGKDMLLKAFRDQGVSLNELKPSKFHTFILNAESAKDNINEDTLKKYRDLFYHSSNIRGKTFLGSNSILQKLILSTYPVNDNGTINDYKKAFESFITEHINDNLEASHFLNHLFEIRNNNPRGHIYAGHYINDKETVDFVNSLDSSVKEKLENLNLIKTGKVGGIVSQYFNDEELLVHHFLYDLVPSNSIKGDVLKNQMQALNERGSKGNIYGGVFSGTETSSDWAPTSSSIITNFKLNEFSLPQRNFYNNVVSTAAEFLDTNPTNTFIDVNNKEAVIVTRGAFGDVKEYDKPLQADEAKSTINFLKDIMDPSTVGALVKKKGIDVPTISVNTVTSSKHGPQYSTMTFDISGSTAKQLEEVNAIKESDYKSNSKLKEKADKEGFAVIPDKLTVTIETNKVPELQKIRIDDDIMSLRKGDIRGSYDQTGAEIKITDITYKSGLPVVDYEVTYKAVEIDTETGKPKIVRKTVKPNPYPATSSMSWSEIENSLLTTAYNLFRSNLPTTRN